MCTAVYQVYEYGFKIHIGVLAVLKYRSLFCLFFKVIDNIDFLTFSFNFLVSKNALRKKESADQSSENKNTLITTKNGAIVKIPIFPRRKMLEAKPGKVGRSSISDRNTVNKVYSQGTHKTSC